MSVNMLELHARELLKMPEEWRIFRWEALSNGTEYFATKLTGAIAPIKTKGKNKGHRNWKQRDKATEREVTILQVIHRAWCVEWEVKTGKCSTCGGDGTVFASWNYITGTEYRPCHKCNGTGNCNQHLL